MSIVSTLLSCGTSRSSVPGNGVWKFSEMLLNAGFDATYSMVCATLSQFREFIAMLALRCRHPQEAMFFSSRAKVPLPLTLS